MDLEGLSRQVTSGLVSVPAACARIDSLLYGLSKHDRQISVLLPSLCSLLACLLNLAQSQEAVEALSTLLHPSGPLLTSLIAATLQDGSLYLEVPHGKAMEVPHLPAIPVTRSGQVQLNLVEYTMWMLMRMVLKTGSIKSFRQFVGNNIPVEAGELRWSHEAGATVYLKTLSAWLQFFLPASSAASDLTILNSQLIPKSSVGQAVIKRLQDWFTRTLLSLLSTKPEVNVDLVMAIEQITVHLVDSDWWLAELAPWLVNTWKEWPLDGSSAILTSLLHSIACLPTSSSARSVCLQLGMSAWLEHQELTVQAMLAASSLGDRCDWTALATQVTPLAWHAHALLETQTKVGDKERAIRLVHGWDRLAAELASHGIALPILETCQNTVCRVYHITEADYAITEQVKQVGHIDRLSLLKTIRSDPHASDHLVRSHEWAPLVPLCQYASSWLNAHWIRWLSRHPHLPITLQRHRWNLRFMASIRLWCILIGGWLLYLLFK